jgi:putative lipoic acid-binding regulatory protein
MTDDLVEWLRSSAGEYGNARCDEAADRIEQLEAALRQLAETDLTGVAIAALGEKKDD